MEIHTQMDYSPVLADAQRPPHFNTRNRGSGYVQVISDDSHNATTAEAHHGLHTQALLQRLVQEHAMMQAAIEIPDDGDSSSSSSSSDDGDEGLGDHQRGDADLGYSCHVEDVTRHLTHHHFCDCPLCPYRRHASVAEWLFAAVIPEPETPGSMYPEQGSGELSLGSSMFLETSTRPPTPGQVLVELGAWDADGVRRYATGDHHHHYNYVLSPLWLIPERILPRQLEACIPEEIEEGSE